MAEKEIRNFVKNFVPLSFSYLLSLPVFLKVLLRMFEIFLLLFLASGVLKINSDYYIKLYNSALKKLALRIGKRFLFEIFRSSIDNFLLSGML